MAFLEAPSLRLAWFVVIAVFVSAFLQNQVKFPLEDSNRNDFKHLYLGSRLLVRGESPYPAENLHQEAASIRHPDMRRLNPYVYPPFTGYFFGWLGKMDYDTANTVWFWGSQGLLLLSLCLLWGGVSTFPPLPRMALILGSVAFLFPLYRSTTAGQLNHFLLFLLSCVFALWRLGHKKTAGSVLGLAALIKVQPAFLVIWLAWKREWAALATAVVTVLLLVLIPATRYGLNPYFEYVEIAGQMGYGSSTWSEQGNSFYVDPGNIGVPAFLYRTLAENPMTENWIDLGKGAYYLSVFWALLVFGICLSCCRIRRHDEDPEMEMAVWVLGMLLIPSLFWDHYLVLALPSWLILLSRLGASGVGDWVMVAVAICWAWMGTWIVWSNPAYLSGPGILMLSLTLPPVLLLFGLSAWIARNSHFNRTGRNWQ